MTGADDWQPLYPCTPTEPMTRVIERREAEGGIFESTETRWPNGTISRGQSFQGTPAGRLVRKREEIAREDGGIDVWESTYWEVPAPDTAPEVEGSGQ